MRRRGLLLMLSVVLVNSGPGQQLPDGFSSEVIVSGLNIPVAIALTGDGRMFTTEKNTGSIMVSNLSGDRQFCGLVPEVTVDGDRAVGGIAVDPSWPAKPYIYVQFSALEGAVHLARFTIVGDLGDEQSVNLSLGGRYEILTTIPDASSRHNGGSVRFGPDGMLYVSSGDDGDPCAAQTYVDGKGTILRLDVSHLPDGSGGPPSIATVAPPDNPFPTSAGLGPLVWSYGLRNPFRFNIDPQTGYLYVADVGEALWEELDEVTIGGQNFGWPSYEGNQPFLSCTSAAPPFVAPIAAVSHAESFSAILSFGGRYRNQNGGSFNFGADYEGDLFFHDFMLGEIRRLKWDGAEWVSPPPVAGQPGPKAWATGFVGVTDAVLGSDGAIYYIKLATGEVCRLKSDTANSDRLSVVGGDDQTGVAGQVLSQPLTVQLTTADDVPIPGMPVTFSIVEGQGVLGPQPVLTDVTGMASTTAEMSETQIADLVVQASSPTSGSTEFRTMARGLVIEYYAQSQTLFVNVRMSTPRAPLSLAFDIPVFVPYAVTPYGSIWTSVLDPRPTLSVINGLFTDDKGIFRISSPVPATAGTTLMVQVFGNDIGLPEPERVFISNPVRLALTPNVNVPQIDLVEPQVTVGTAGRPLMKPMTVQVKNAQGTPLIGAPVYFSLVTGSGTLDPLPQLTDEQGIASSSLTLSTTDSTNPRVSASVLSSDPVSFDIVWRGITLDYDESLRQLDVLVNMGVPNAPVHFTWDPVQVSTPYLETPWGDIWTSILEPSPTAGVVSGLTDADGLWQRTISGLPPGTYTLQGAGVDPSLPADFGLFMISLPVTMTFD